MKTFLPFIIACIFSLNGWCQDAYYIKSAQFEGIQSSAPPFFKLNEKIIFSFDNLLGNEATYTYQITRCDANWQKLNYNSNEYLNGIQNVGISDVKNSFNTFQSYSHYTIRIPNQNQRITKTGNYVLEVFNEEDVMVLKRQLIVYDDALPLQCKYERMRDLATIDQKQNISVVINTENYSITNPDKTIRVEIFKNGRLDQKKVLNKPRYVLGNQLHYTYDEASSFWAGNEFPYIDNGNIRSPNNTIARVALNDLFESYLYPDQPSKQYTFTKDLNGAFYPYVKYNEKNTYTTESDYAWVFFSLKEPRQTQPIYIVGMFNNYEKNQNSEMVYNEENHLYELPLLIKQGFTSYTYETKDNNADDTSLLGNFAETENEYYVVVYYKAPIDRYEQIIGMGIVSTIVK